MTHFYSCCVIFSLHILNTGNHLCLRTPTNLYEWETDCLRSSICWKIRKAWRAIFQGFVMFVSDFKWLDFLLNSVDDAPRLLFFSLHSLSSWFDSLTNLLLLMSTILFMAILIYCICNWRPIVEAKLPFMDLDSSSCIQSSIWKSFRFLFH